MTELNERQIAKLTVYIIRQMLWDPELLRAIAREQALGWTLKEYGEVFEEEDEHEKQV